MVDRLQQIVKRPLPQRFPGILKLPVAADEDKNQLAAARQHLFHQCDAVDDRHADIADDNLRRRLFD
ncbi:hypothetical protein D3C74_447340 [compost metagenome]